MIPLLALFGVKTGYGMSPFAVDINSPSELLASVNQFSRSPKRNTRGDTRRQEEDLDQDNSTTEVVDEDGDEYEVEE